MVLTVTDFGNGSIALPYHGCLFLYFKETMEVREIKVRQIMCCHLRQCLPAHTPTGYQGIKNTAQ